MWKYLVQSVNEANQQKKGGGGGEGVVFSVNTLFSSCQHILAELEHECLNKCFP